MNLSKLKRLEIREAWPHEAIDFTRWLAEPNNISLLSEEIGVDVNVIRTEAPVGRFSVDILAQDGESDDKIIIENQLEYTDHSHLGQIITYASGLNAKHIIWIVRDVREEHRQAVDWLNEHTDSDLNFFLLRIELWQIDDSAAAPVFVTISKPNYWHRAMSRSSERNASSELDVFRLDFWTGFGEFVKEHGERVRLCPIRPGHALDLRRERQDCHVYLTVDTRLSAVTCNLSVDDSEELFRRLHELRPEIERDLAPVGQLKWTEELPAKRSFITVRAQLDCNLENRDAWRDYYVWLAEAGERFTSVFSRV